MKKKFRSKSRIIIVFQMIFMMIFGTVLIQPAFAENQSIKVIENTVLESITVLSASEGRILFSDDYNYGYLDYDGNIVIPAQFEDANDFNSGFALVTTESGDAYIDETGKVVLTLQNIADEFGVDVEDLDTYGFSNGFARVDNYDSVGYINTKGEVAVPFGTYYDGDNFGDGLVMVYDDNYDSYFIKSDGTEAFKLNENYDYYSFSNHRAVVYDYESDQYGYVDESGKLIVPFILDDAFDYQGNIAIYQENGKYGILDENGKTLLDPIFKDVKITEDGYVVGEDGVFTMILDGKMQPMYKFLSALLPDVYDNLFVEFDVEDYVFKDFSGSIIGHYEDYDYLGDHLFEVNGSRLIDTRNVKAVPTEKNAFNINAKYEFKFIDNTGKVVLDLSDYDDVQPFSEGRAVVEKEGKYGYIDKTGAVVVPIQYDSADSFIDGEAYVEYGNESYILNLDGSITNSYDAYDEDENSDFYTITKDTYGDVGLASHTTNQIVLEPKYSYIEAMGNDVFLLEKDYLYGYYDAKTKKLIEPKFENLDIYSDDSIIVVESEDYLYGIYDLNGNVIMEPQYDYISALDNGLYEVVNEDQLSGVVDRKGNMIINVEYDYIESYVTEDNIAIFSLEIGDTYTTLIYNLDSHSVINRTLGGYPIELGENCVVMNSDDGETSIVNFNGNTVYRTFDSFMMTSGEYYQFADEDDFYYIVDELGKVYLKGNDFYDLYLPVDSGHLIFMKDDMFGIVALDGTIKTETLYDQVSYINAGIMAVYDNEEFGYVNVDGKNIVKMGEYDFLYNFTEGLGLVIKAVD